MTYVGRTDPKYEMNVNTDLSLAGLGGVWGVHANVAYQNGMTQFNSAALTSDAYLHMGNAQGIPLAMQAAIVAASNGGHSNIGLYQTVNVLRFQSLSINYVISQTIARRFGVPQMSVALQGSNLGLHTNYRGKDPNVNAYSTGNAVGDTGQLPQPRTWTLTVRLGN
jgi:hypothetical protein